MPAPSSPAIVRGHVGDITRLPSRHHFASYAGVAPIEASSGPKKRHRLNPRGNRQLNHALHIIAIAQIRYDTPAASTTSASSTRTRPRRKRCGR